MFITLKLCILLLASVGLVAARFKGPAADLNLMRFMAETRDEQQNNPDRTLECFIEYSPIFQDNLDCYEREYKSCLSTAEAQRIVIDEEYQPERNFIENAAYGACSSLYECKKLNASKDAFDCYVTAGSGNTMVMYNISANASVASAEIEEQYRTILFDQYRCTNASENKYAQSTADTYESLHLCLKGERAIVITSTPASKDTTTPSPSPEPTPEQSPSTEPTPTLEPSSTLQPSSTLEPSEKTTLPNDSPARSFEGRSDSFADKMHNNIASLLNQMRDRLTN